MGIVRICLLHVISTRIASAVQERIVEVLRRLPRCRLMSVCHIIDRREVVRVLKMQLG